MGEISNVVFHNRENGFTVLHCKPQNTRLRRSETSRSLRKAVWIRVHGVWEENTRWGMQLRIRQWEYASPAGKEGLIRFLGGGFIAGIVPAVRRPQVEHFGERTLESSKKNRGRLLEVPGIVRSRMTTICESTKNTST